MSNLWLDRPWFMRGLLYHLYLVVLKDNYYHAKRAGRWLRVNARLGLRYVVRFLTGMLVALTAGHSVYMTGWERYKYAATRRSNYHDVPARLVGRPVVYKNGLDKLGMTEFHQDYVPRAEQLAPRRARAALRQKNA